MSIRHLPSCFLTRRHISNGIICFGICGGSRIARATTDLVQPGATTGPRPPNSHRDPWLTLPPTSVLPRAGTSDLVSIDDANIFFARFGSGPSVLLLHGGLASSNYWGNQIGPLAERFCVTVMDTRGHGRSTLPSESLSYALFARDVIGLLDLLRIDQTSIIGWSDGGITALQLAMNYPTRVSKLFVFGANSSVDGLRAGGAKSHVFSMFLNRCRGEYYQLSPNPEKWPHLIKGLTQMWHREPNFTAGNLHSINAPTIVSDGWYDEIIRRAHTERLARKIPNAKLLILSAVSHFAMLQRPDQFNKCILDFL